ncbi:hypothetical protein [Xanthobacter flavus]|uniref:hypothetical protein n=1 Tax=Xanthobacter flavus TaxID=281 RepID=UPI001AEA7873|nr:hypothetical protein [Xanthobacter flavus]MBP2147958.1 hypothetical protein [Xanthobacter flavus]
MDGGGVVLVIVGLLFAAILIARRWMSRGSRVAAPQASAQEWPRLRSPDDEVADFLNELQDDIRRRQNAAGRRAVSAFMRVPLTKQQREFATAAHEFLRRDDPLMAQRFAVEPGGLRAPCDAEMLDIFKHRGLWLVETSLETMLRDGEITKAEKLSYHRSLRSLENKMHACLDEKKYRLS